MANQPKKYKKFVATAATATLVASAIVPVASAANLSDISGNTHEEAINALVDAGVINGYPDGTFKPNKTLSRSDVVKLLGKYLETEGYAPASNWKTSPAFNDLTTASNEELLKYASVVKEAGVFVGSNGNLLASDSITRENMAIVLVRMVNTVKGVSLEEFVAEQDFKGDVKDLAQAKAEARSAISVLDYYDITNPTVANFNPKGDTTRGQFATFLYKTINAEISGAEVEGSKVVPEKIELAETSIQGKFGEKVTLTAKVTVKEGESAENIAVKFDIFHEKLANDTTIVPQITETVKTNAEGVATYTYTRSQGEVDTVNAYAVNKPGSKAAAKVYWNTSLTIADVTKETTLANGEQKVYQITGDDNEVVYVAFKENLNVAPEKAVRDVEFLGLATTGDTASTGNFAYEYTTGGYKVGVVKLDATGKANLVLTGSDASVTPIVFVNNPGTNAKYDATALQATGSTVKFEKESVFDLTVTAEGKQTAAVHKAAPTDEIGGRDYVVTLKTKAGKVVPNSPVKVTFEEATTNNLGTLKVYDADGVEVPRTTNDTFVLTTDKDGKALFTVTQSVVDSFATPIVFLETGSKVGLDSKDLQVTSEITYFRAVKAGEYTSELKVTNEEKKEVTTFGSAKLATFTYQLSDQNGKPRSAAEVTNASTSVQFTVRTDASEVTVYDVDGVTELGKVSAYSTQSFVRNIATTGTEATIKVKGDATNVRVTATPTNSGLSGLTSVTKAVTFLAGASTSYFSIADTTKTTADSITLTFTEAVSANDVVVSEIANATKASDSTDNKVVYVYFNDPKLTAGSENFSISYKGKTYKFKYDPATGKISSRDN
ncbi:S-layer homology domain-containing protein [Lysinibacillus louembei]|uniref:S-layer homology domain-containing protein n=1 Tax=Lysinibacillus louembei TaxID=1470088 RepID=A0ABZ0RZR0_9BACI|nr:S-layer homology domain-containing protein [Lysinibacillus louembei]WPK12486.1 S-layer homology domain-containing protein [Lysinibacillus louembei]